MQSWDVLYTHPAPVWREELKGVMLLAGFGDPDSFCVLLV